MVLINNAYDILSDPQRRAAYDAALKEQPEKISRSKTSQQAKRSRSCLRTTMNGPKIPALIAIAFLISCLAGSQIGTLHTDDMSVSGQFMKTNRHFFGAIVHESLAALPLFIPGFGLIWGILGGFTTGFVDKAVIMMAPNPVLLYVVLAVMIKLTAYYIGMCRSMTLAISIKRRRFTKLDGIFTMGDVVLAVLLSSLAGYLEHASAYGV